MELCIFWTTAVSVQICELYWAKIIFKSYWFRLEFIDGVSQRTSGIINFVVDESLVPVSEQNVYHLSKWFRSVSLNPWYYARYFFFGLESSLELQFEMQSSRVFVANNHLVWALPAQRKPSKRFGTLIRSPVKGLNDMMRLHQNEVQDFILERLWTRNGNDIGHTGGDNSAAMVI